MTAWLQICPSSGKFDAAFPGNSLVKVVGL